MKREVIEDMARDAWEYADLFIVQYGRQWTEDEPVHELKLEAGGAGPRPGAIEKTEAEKAAINAEIKKERENRKELKGHCAAAIFTMLLQEGLKEQREKEKRKSTGV